MDRQLAIIGNYKYLVENYNAETDMQNNYYSAEFVMIRNFTVMNNLICDHDIYIIESKYFNEYIQELKESGSTSGKSIAFPITGSNVISYSNSYTKFNYSMNTINNSSIYVGDEYGIDVYKIYEKQNNKLVSKKIKCNKLRIYHPLTRKSINALIDINNYINNIHFHYLCKPITDYKSNSETEIKYCNETYSEYIDIYYPNIEDIFKINVDGSYSSFYIEDLEIVASTYNSKFINSIMSDSKDLIQCEEYEGKQIVPMNLLIQPYRIVEEYNSNNKLNYDDDLSNDDKIFVKLYLKTAVSIENNYIVYPINATIFPYSEIDDSINMYILDDYVNAITISFNTPCRFKLMSRTGFSDGTISIVTMFDYPNKSYFYNLAKEYNLSHESKTSAVLEAYKYYNNVGDNNYKMFTNDEIVRQLEDIDAVDTLSPEAIKYTKETLYLPDNIDKNKVLELWKINMKETLINEYEEEFGTPGNFLGFKLEIATDNLFKNIIYDKNYRINFKDLDDFAFKLNDIFKSWNQKPSQLMARAIFYDRILGFKITGNLIVISKEWFKFMVNNNVKGRVNELSNINKIKGLLNDNMKIIDLKEDNINFINNINCVVSKKYEGNSINSSLNNNQKIIFKPIFYRTSDLQNVRIRSNVTQNIGINLMKYMTKVDTFKMKIDNIEYIETARNDAYVIFNINALNLKTISGTYDITNQDDEFISSGSYILY